VSVYCRRVVEPEDIHSALPEAVAAARSGGPAVLLLPKDIQQGCVDVNGHWRGRTAQDLRPIGNPHPVAQVLRHANGPVTIIVDKDGGYQLKLPDAGAERVDLPTLGVRVKALADANPDVSVILAGDEHVPYGVVANAMNYVSAAGVQKISLLSKPPEGK
jgi:acetolactate synthase-1/2/3 large subunit